MAHEENVHKSWVSRICYAIGNLGQAAFYNALSTFFVTYYAAQTLFRDYEDSEAEAMIAIITALVFIIRIAEIFIDPLLGNLVDNTTSRFGRFKPWQVIGGVGSLRSSPDSSASSTSTKECSLLFLSSSSWFLTSCTPCVTSHTGA